MVQRIVVVASVVLMVGMLIYGWMWERKAKRGAQSDPVVAVPVDAAPTMDAAPPPPTPPKISVDAGPPAGHTTALALFKTAKAGEWSAFAIKYEAKPKPLTANVFWRVDKVADTTVVLTIKTRRSTGATLPTVTRKLPKLGLTVEQVLSAALPGKVIDRRLTGYGSSDKTIWGKRPKGR